MLLYSTSNEKKSTNDLILQTLNEEDQLLVVM